MKKVLGLDLGSRTCGIAMSDILGMIAHGVETFRFKHVQNMLKKLLKKMRLKRLF